MIGKSLIFFFAGLCVVSATVAKYHLCRVMPRNADQLMVLQRLHNSKGNLIFLNKVQREGNPVILIVSSSELNNFKDLTGGAQSSCRPLDKDIQPDELANKVADPKNENEKYSWTEFHELDDTYNWLRSLVTRFPKRVSLLTAGSSFEGRKILGVRISFQKKNKAIFVEGGYHGSEWISPAVVNYITHQILTRKDLKFRSLVEKFDWYIVPHTNPDGYVYTHTSDRFWRKTVSRQINSNSSCFGVDLNRNWGYHWNENNDGSNSCSNIYPGPEKFSEIESKSLSKFLQKLKEKLLLHLTIDGSNQWLLSPFGYANKSARNRDDLKRMTEMAIDGIKRNFGTEYTGGQMSSVLYPISGSSMDWVYGELGIDYSFILRLPPKVKFGMFLELISLVPSAQIVPIGEEVLYGLKELIQHL